MSTQTDIATKEARYRLEVLKHDTEHEDLRHNRRLTHIEHVALTHLLKEIHRLNEAISHQEKMLMHYRERKIKARHKPAATRSAHTKPHGTTQKGMSTLAADLSIAALIVTLLAAVAYFNIPGPRPAAAQGDYPQHVTAPGQYVHIITATATAVKATSGTLLLLAVNSPQTGTVSLFDLTGANCTGTPSTNTFAVLTTSSSASGNWVSLPFNASFTNGICLKASVTAMDITAVYQ